MTVKNPNFRVRAQTRRRKYAINWRRKEREEHHLSPHQLSRPTAAADPAFVGHAPILRYVEQAHNIHFMPRKKKVYFLIRVCSREGKMYVRARIIILESHKSGFDVSSK